MSYSMSLETHQQVDRDYQFWRTNTGGWMGPFGVQDNTLRRPSHDNDHRQNEIQIDKISRGIETRTTVMIRNLPPGLTLKQLLKSLNAHVRGRYSFVYLRANFNTGRNVGYAFVDFISTEAMIDYTYGVGDDPWPPMFRHHGQNFTVTFADIQGHEALVDHFRNSAVMLQEPRFRPHVSPWSRLVVFLIQILTVGTGLLHGARRRGARGSREALPFPEQQVAPGSIYAAR